MAKLDPKFLRCFFCRSHRRHVLKIARSRTASSSTLICNCAKVFRRILSCLHDCLLSWTVQVVRLRERQRAQAVSKLPRFESVDHGPVFHEHWGMQDQVKGRQYQCSIIAIILNFRVTMAKLLPVAILISQLSLNVLMVGFAACEPFFERLCDTSACRYRAAHWWWPRFSQDFQVVVSLVSRAKAAAALARSGLEVKQYIGLCRGREADSKVMGVACGRPAFQVSWTLLRPTCVA